MRMIIIAAVVALAGCTAQVSVSSFDTQLSTLFTKIGAFTVADLQAADVDAKAHNDTVAAMCYEAVIPLVKAASATPLAAPAGVVSAFQDLRDGVNTTNAAQGLVKQLEVPCGPLAADVNMNLVQLIAKISGAVVPGVGIAAGLLP